MKQISIYKSTSSPFFMRRLFKPESNLRYCIKLEQLLQSFPLAKESDKIQVISHNDKIAIAYLTEGNMRINQTHFDLGIRGEICDILGFEIKEENKRKGYGRLLYLIIEDFSRYLN